MMSALPGNAAVVVLGPSGAALGKRVRAALPSAALFGPRALAGECDEGYDRLADCLTAAFAEGRPIVGICASGILVRLLAPLIADKHDEPPVVAAAEDGSVAVPLLGGHRGANAIARHLSGVLGCVAAITTAGDLRLGFALDEPPPGWRVGDPEPAKPVAAALLAGRPVALTDELGVAAWLRAGTADWAESAELGVLVTDRVSAADPATFVLNPPILALGIGCERGCGVDEIAALAENSLAAARLSPLAIAAVVSVALKMDEPAVHALAASLGVPARFFPAERLLGETPRLTERSEAAFRATGCWGVAEGAALAAAGSGGQLIVPKRKSLRATCAIARAPAPIDAAAIGAARGRLAVIGIGPGDAAWRTAEAGHLLAASTDLVGYSLYLDLLGPAAGGRTRHDSAIGAEAARARLALDLAASGRQVALVSSGDAGIYGLAALVFELLDRDPRRDWRAVELVVAPGVSAMQAAAARIGAPLGHDFCAISLSDLLTPWAAIRARVEAAAHADFVVALYNPRSARRTTRLAEAAAILLADREPETPVVIARNLGRPGEAVSVVALADLAAAEVDMLTLVIVGNRQTRRVGQRVYTPRGYFP
ncbi:MAG TPA: precorrin-3B C(17)-methyltransferase [Stellaceae bacterium]|jgi:cobalt-precorrin 5A hydrolase/precorrin-3B C17-methyltransferase|nr:precorrin-3B C(17)-methyltransferase [Stellaceae bacterium]